MAAPSQAPNVNWIPDYPYPAGYGGWRGMTTGYGGFADAIIGNQLGSFLNYGDNLQNAMNQMLMVNLMNQRAQQNNNNLNAQLGQTRMNSDALVQAALAGALGNIGSAYQNRLGTQPVDVVNAQNQGALQRLQALPGILSSISGMFNMGGGGGGGGGLLGFQNPSGGQSAILPGAPQTATQKAVQASQPLPQQAQQTAAAQPMVNARLAAAASGRSAMPYQSPRDYLAQYLGRV